MKKHILIGLIIVFVVILIPVCYFLVGWAPKQDKITWGVDFSQMQAESLKLNWKEAYLALINNLGVKNIKLHTQWDWLEGKEGTYFFDDTDWQVKTAEQNNVKIIYVLGLKTGRWPECHAPEWFDSLSVQEQQNKLLDYIKETVLRYKNSNAVAYWQVENEPLLEFGECPAWYYKNKDFLKKEIELVKSLDSSRQVIISDSGELNWWINAAKLGDIVGTTMYRKAWVNLSSFGILNIVPDFYGTYLIPPVYYWRKSQMIKAIFDKDVWCVELQAEPWPRGTVYDVSLDEQFKTMNLKQFKKNVEYAKLTGLDTFYFWGAEWWYWLKEKQNMPEIWKEAATLFNN